MRRALRCDPPALHPGAVLLRHGDLRRRIATLAVSFYPYMLPFSIAIADATSSAASLSFMFWGAGVIVLPITLIYTLVVYFVFKGKVDPDTEYQ